MVIHFSQRENYSVSFKNRYLQIYYLQELLKSQFDSVEMKNCKNYKIQLSQ